MDVMIVNGAVVNKIQGNRSIIQHVSYINVRGATFLAVASSSGFQLWTPNGDTMMHFFSLSSLYPVRFFTEY
jgi:hypothetical protein